MKRKQCAIKEIDSSYMSLVLSVTFYLAAILVAGVIPVRYSFSNCLPFEMYLYVVVFPIVFSIVAFSFGLKFKNIESRKIKFLLLSFMIYFALVFGANNVFDFVLSKTIEYYELKEKDSEQLWALWTNDLSRNLLYVFAVPISLFMSCIYFLFIRTLRSKLANENF